MSSQSISEDEDDPEWDDAGWSGDESSGGGMLYVSLFCDTQLPSAETCFNHDESKYSFNVLKYRAEHSLDDHGVFKCINYTRRCVADGVDPLPGLSRGPVVFADDSFLRPVLENDGLLAHDYEEEDDDNQDIPADSDVAAQLASQLEQMRADNESLRETVAYLRRLGIQDLELDVNVSPPGGPTSRAAPDADSGPRQTADIAQLDKRPPARTEQVDEAYFDSYATFDIHREMLEDKARTNAYRKALEENPALIRGASVMDVGCGTGILSMFAARAGAARVLAIEAAPDMASVAEKNCIHNKLHASVGGSITVATGKVEEMDAVVVAPQSVDVIVSEWMGYMGGLFETMLPSVLYARDKYLKPGGALLPDRVALWAAAADASAAGLSFWDNVYGFSFPSVRESIAESCAGKPIVGPVNPKSLLSSAAVVQDLDLMHVTAADLDFHSAFDLRATAGGMCACVVLWFDAFFSERFCTEAPAELSTAPHRPLTHWVQTTLLLKRAVGVAEGDLLRCVLSMAGGERHRSLDVSLEVKHVGVDGAVASQQVAAYVMEVSSADVADRSKKPV
eukprot:jgi/Ulvmu1/4255/UM193_0003.1